MVLHHLCYLRTVCGKDFTLTHALSCPHGASPIIWHYEVCDLIDDRSVSQCPGGAPPIHAILVKLCNTTQL